MLKDGGIKARIIKQYVPVMNKLINKYLQAFDLFVDFQLDENFNEVIKSRFRDTFSYASFSEGEKLRITLAIMLSWRAVAKLRNSVSTNLLILDETLDGALDGVGIEMLIDTLHNLNSDDNIFVISHRGHQFGDKFMSHIKFDKVKNFSEIAS
jgi:energy-coupling factor transporter ATP-binding protein EcfA2